MSSFAVLCFISAVLGLFFVFLFKYCSPQSLIRRVKKEIHALFLESYLFRHSPRVVLVAQLRLLLQGGLYFLCALIPFVVLSIPGLPLFSMLDEMFGYAAVSVEQPAIIRARALTGTGVTNLQLKADEGVDLSPPVRVADGGEVYWRATPRKEGDHQLVLTTSSGESFEVPFSTGTGQKNGRKEYMSGLWKPLLFAAGRIPDAASKGLAEVEIEYPGSEYSFLGMHMSWIPVFLVVSFVSALLVVRRLKVSF